MSQHPAEMVAVTPAGGLAPSTAARLLWVRGLRAFADGFVSLLLPIYLGMLGMPPFQVGVIVTVTLLGSGMLTLWVGLRAYRHDYRTLLLLATALMAATGIGFAVLSDFWPLLLVAFIGTLNPSGGDVSVFLPLEHALLARAADERRRTALFARYSVVGTLVAAVGTLFAGLPDMVAAAAHAPVQTAFQAMFGLYALVGVLSAWIYRKLPPQRPAAGRASDAPLKESKRRVLVLAALFSLDAFGGGFVVQSLLALWLFQKYQLSALAAGAIFFWTGVLSALSYLVAAKVADRFGLLNTMVFTHLPSSLLLIAIPFMPTLGWALALLLARSALSQMDVPTRSSYVMAVVTPRERPAAASITSVPRSLMAALSPVLAGYLLNRSTFGWPLVAAGAAKIVYDVLLYLMFRNVRPPEASQRSAARSA
ncbi:MAG: MFS transporter [Massilia sp.]